MTKDFNQLYTSIDYRFKDESYLVRALTHRSKGKKNYERLEFLGDSILGFVMAEIVFNKFPDEDEGKLTQIRTKLIKGKTLSKMAKSMDLAEHIILGASEQSGGGHKRDRILEDVFESIIGAIYLDSDFVTVKQRVLNWYKEILENLNSDTAGIKDNKSKLQEILLQNAYTLPVYNILKSEGKDHEQIFTIEAICEPLDLRVESKADTRKKAEQLAAGQLIDILAEKEIYEKKK